MDLHPVDKPSTRNSLRNYLGKEFYILKRRLKWLFSSRAFAIPTIRGKCSHLVFWHKSFLMRPLKDVDMYLQHNKVRNLQLAVAKINGVLLKPDQTFSLWKLVGKPSRRKGYLEGLVLENGKIGKGTGGGLCQLGNLLYWMGLHSPLTITERWRHGYDVFPDLNRTIPFACGATLSYNYIDLQVRNDTNNTFQIFLSLDAEYLHGEILSELELTESFRVVETEHQIRQQWWGGYTRHNKIWKQRLDLNKALISEELVAENHAIMMYNPLLE
jgi:vancomycin resistance protein VanW